jgi:putative membrane protein
MIGAPLLALLAVAYLGAARRARRWPASRSAAFLAGLAVLAVALASPLAGAAEDELSLHMVQHLLLTLAAPPLLVLGRPITLLLGAMPRAEARAAAGIMRAPAARALANPLVAAALFSTVLVGSHVPAFYDATLRSPPLHAAEHAAYFWSAVLLWALALRSEPLTAAASPLVRILALLLAMPPMALVGVALLTWNGPAYSGYGSVTDQHLAGWMMWVGGSAVVAVATVAAGWQALVREEARQAKREARRAAQGAAALETRTGGRA